MLVVQVEMFVQGTHSQHLVMVLQGQLVAQLCEYFGQQSTEEGYSWIG